MLKRTLILTAGALLMAGCESGDDSQFLGLDTTADPTFMDRATTMESPPTADFRGDWRSHTHHHSTRSTSIAGGDSADRADWNQSERRPDFSESSTSVPDRSVMVMTGSPEAEILSLLHSKNQEEIEAGKLAQERGYAPAVRAYGRDMVVQHTDADRKVLAVAAECDVALQPSLCEPDRTDGAKADSMASLRALRGEEFDREFTRVMEAGHQDLIQKVEDARDEVQNDRVRALLDELLPVLREHHQKVSQVVGR